MDKKQNSATRAKDKYNSANYDQIKFVVPKGDKGVIDAAAGRANKSRNAFIYEAIKEKMEREGLI